MVVHTADTHKTKLSCLVRVGGVNKLLQAGAVTAAEIQRSFTELPKIGVTLLATISKTVSGTKSVCRGCLGCEKHPWLFGYNMQCSDLLQTQRLRRERADRKCPERNRLRDLDFENVPLNVCQCHKSRSRSPEVTVDATRPLDLPMKSSLYVSNEPTRQQKPKCSRTSRSSRNQG